MRKFLLLTTLVCLFVFSPPFIFTGYGQDKKQPPPSDSSLLALAKKYVHTTIKKTISSDGNIFLQRDLTSYLQATVQKVTAVAPSDFDYGHEHKDEMLRSFLNRPHPTVATLNKYFTAAAREFKVPADLLKAVAQVQSNWTQVSESMYGSWGIMGLIENKYVQQISLAASLLHVKQEQIKNEAKTNIRAAAALLASYQKNKTATALEEWFEAVKMLSGLQDAAMNNELAVRIFDVLKNGSKTVTLWGEIITLEPKYVSLSKGVREPDIASPPNIQRTMALDYPAAVSNFTTCNFNNRPAGSVIKYYFVHYVATGTYQGAVSWFKDCSSNVSAHYVIRNSDGEISQVVAENDRAWSQGVTTYNDLGIGVEHEVLASNLAMWDSEPMLVAAANLCKDVCSRQAIPKLRRVNNGDAGIYGHSDVRATDCPNLTPARWTSFLNRLATVSVLPPTLYSISNSGSGTQLTATWKASTEPTLVGYRLYYADNDALASWSLAANETTLTETTTTLTLNATQFLAPPSGDVYHFKLTAIVKDANHQLVESSSSDIYSRSSSTTGPKVLVVDGFDRTTGSYTNSTHAFAARYVKSLRNKASLQISTVANEKVEDGSFVLNNYDIVVWFVGDESSANVVLSSAEKTAIKNYLDGGGKLLFTGSEVAYNIGRSASTAYDLAFMNNYLKSSYVNDGTAAYTPATGIAGTAFEGLTLPFGFTYMEDFPDAISPINGATAILNYSVAPNKAGIAYKGLFGTGTKPGALIFLSFTLETAVDTSMTSFMSKALSYFDVSVMAMPTANADAAITQTRAAKRMNVLANDDNNGVAIDATSLTIVAYPANGTVTSDTVGNVTYISNAGFTGNDAYQYKVRNINGEFSNITTVSITVVGLIPCNPSPPEVDDLAPKHELRGAWVSTVSNIDWPSSRTLTTAQQQAELLKILDTLSATGMNTVYLQVRPEGDAIYQSAIEPWSYWLTNAQGTAPSPFWDPLAFAITEAHARGMELHAWLNPYRAKQSTPTLAPNHVVSLHPDWTFTSGTLTMLNPGLPEVRNYVTQIIADIATRYNIDGIHFDDYFYPAAGMTGQDTATFTLNNPTRIAAIDDWRRNNVNLLITKVYDTINAINTVTKRSIKFGVSPFGIWKSGTPTGITGSSSFSAQYCDPIAWLLAGKVDYVAPQLYWKISGPQDYTALSKWWNDQGVAYNRHIYPGLALYRLTDASNWPAGEIENQIILNKDQNHEQVKGQILFSTKQMMANTKGIKTLLQTGQYKYKAIPPAMYWKDASCPNAPVNVRLDGDTLRWEAIPGVDGDLPAKYIVYKFASAEEASNYSNDGKKIYAVVWETKLAIPAATAVNNYFVVTSLDKANNESEVMSGAVLPMRGLEFTVRLTGHTALLFWSTLTEINTQRFEIERSLDGRHFTYLASVAAAGRSANKKNYSLQDFLQINGSYYYRLKSIDRDGRTSYSGVQMIVYHSDANEIVLGPNPFTSGISINNLHDVKRIEMIDLSGRILMNKIVNNQSAIRLDIPNAPAGLYQVRIIKTTGDFTTFKVIKL